MSDHKWVGGSANVSSRACFCIGPQSGGPLCPCAMQNKREQERAYREKLIAEGWTPPGAQKGQDQ